MKVNYLRERDNGTVFYWTPVLNCEDPSEAPTVRYEVQTGNGWKMRINSEYSMLFLNLVIRGYIDGISSGNNYATITGYDTVDELNWGSGNMYFSVFNEGIAKGKHIPTGRITTDKIVLFDSFLENADKSTTWRGSSRTGWAVSSRLFYIAGSGFVIIKNNE